jgi:hypothetical protein
VEGQPFQREGRWWFRSGDDLLVFDETTSEWRLPDDDGADEEAAAESIPAAKAPAIDRSAARTELGALTDEKKKASREEVETGFVSVVDAEREAVAARSAAPVEAAEEETGVLETVPAAAAEPGPSEPAVTPMDTTELEETHAGPAEHETVGGVHYWKCPSCGVVNGRTASICRMCFVPRP